MEKVAFCYVIEYLKRLLPKTAIYFTFEIIPSRFFLYSSFSLQSHSSLAKNCLKMSHLFWLLKKAISLFSISQGYVYCFWFLEAQYEIVLKQKPYDFFHVKALQDFKAQRSQQISFNKGDILNITDTHVIADPQQPYCWDATKQGMSTNIKGYVPRQISPLAPSRIQEHQYEQPNNERINQRPPAPIRAGFYYEILESVGEVLV